jgi:phosphatidylserine/phosphatidylglycerophosphate/cardiolipin synthase-like enzyme
VAAFGKLQGAGIPIVEDKRGPIMHNKFTVVDREWVSTGSWKLHRWGHLSPQHNMIVINSRELAANYTTEFAKMFEKRQFGPTKDKALPNRS